MYPTIHFSRTRCVDHDAVIEEWVTHARKAFIQHLQEIYENRVDEFRRTGVFTAREWNFYCVTKIRDYPVLATRDPPFEGFHWDGTECPGDVCQQCDESRAADEFERALWHVDEQDIVMEFDSTLQEDKSINMRFEHLEYFDSDVSE